MHVDSASPRGKEELQNDQGGNQTWLYRQITWVKGISPKEMLRGTWNGTKGSLQTVVCLACVLGSIGAGIYTASSALKITGFSVFCVGVSATAALAIIALSVGLVAKENFKQAREHFHRIFPNPV
jgi:hypothetical protein